VTTDLIATNGLGRLPLLVAIAFLVGVQARKRLRQYVALT
jgi:hypothetical protein